MMTHLAQVATVASTFDTEYGALLIIGGAIVAIVAIRSATGIMRTHQREKSRREIAAFIAEGSMTPEQGERLMRAGESPRD